MGDGVLVRHLTVVPLLTVAFAGWKADPEMPISNSPPTTVVVVLEEVDDAVLEDVNVVVLGDADDVTSAVQVLAVSGVSAVSLPHAATTRASAAWWRRLIRHEPQVAVGDSVGTPPTSVPLAQPPELPEQLAGSIEGVEPH